MKLLQSVFASILLFGCVDRVTSTEAVKTEVKKTVDLWDLTGKWKSKCIKNDFMGLTHVTYEFDFTPAKGYKKIERYFNDVNCSDIFVTYTVEGSVLNITQNKDSKLVKNINQSVDKQDIQVHSLKAADWLNSLKVCGKNTWKQNEHVDLNGKNCIGYSFDENEIIFDIYKIDHNQLTFGKASYFKAKDKPSTRPDKLDNDIVFLSY